MPQRGGEGGGAAVRDAVDRQVQGSEHWDARERVRELLGALVSDSVVPEAKGLQHRGAGQGLCEDGRTWGGDLIL